MEEITPPVPMAPMVANWTTPVIDTGKVHDELDRLWAAWGEANRKSTAEKARASAEAELMRPSTLNLIAIAESPNEAERIEAVANTLTEFTPSRTVILVRGGAPKSGGLGVRVSVHEHVPGKGQPSIRFETVTVAAKAGNDGVLASVTSPLLVPELPDFLWVPHGQIAGLELLTDLLEIADRLIVDSSTLDNPGEHLRFLADLAGQPAPAPKLTDLAWSRITSWRQLVAQFFDQPATLPSLDSMSEATIEFGTKDGDGRSGLTAGLLFAGWLSTRLDWRAPGELVTVKDGWRLTLRAGARGRSREVLLSLRPTDNPVAKGTLCSVTLVANGPNSGEFKVERASDVGITTTSETATMPTVSRLVYGRVPDESQLMSQELRNFAGDQIFEEALRFAADLWPSEGEG